MAAKFEFEMNESIESSRSIFQRALRFLPNETKLWIEVIIYFKNKHFSSIARKICFKYFKMELMCVELIMKRKELLGIDEKEDSEVTIILNLNYFNQIKQLFIE